ncbi:hypothetical protein ABIE66_000927 [Peribacillus sp. B2I2]|uniref:hypothetical protein n=1 Tax=unclassified Peribacillus TaxID=2675266 RepID=UPI0025A2F145|nr:hypothetical protein [Peribacillus sp. ACCC06369]
MNYSFSVQIFTGFSIHIHKSLKPYGTGYMFLGSFYNQWGDPTATLVTDMRREVELIRQRYLRGLLVEDVFFTGEITGIQEDVKIAQSLLGNWA